MNADPIAAKEAELAATRELIDRHWNTHAGTSSLNGKQHGQRIDAHIRRSAQLHETVQRLERELAGLRTPQPPPAAPVTPEALAAARFVRTKYGWYEVVKVNRATVKVIAAPGMDDLIKASKILECRP